MATRGERTSKKTAAKGKAGKRAAGKKAAVKARPKVKLPQDRALPGMAQVRVVRLDNLCHGIAEVRATLAQCRSEEGDLERAALELMHQYKRKTYQGSGVELVLVPGEEKLRVRVTKAHATAEVEDADDDDGGRYGNGQGLSGLDAVTDTEGIEQAGELD